MFVKKTCHTVGDEIKTQIRLVESYRPSPGANPKQRLIEDCGWLEDQDDPDAFLAELQERCKQARDNSKKIDISINTEKRIHDEDSLIMNYGTFLVSVLYNLLGISDFFSVHRSSRAKYDLDLIFRYLTTMRCVFPDSKRSTYSYIRIVYSMNDTDFKLEDIYRSLDEIAALRYELQGWINKKLKGIFDIDDGKSYFDVTNFYFEMDYAVEGTLPQRGVSKEHRVDPIVSSALLLNSAGLPCIHEAFPGNKSETLMLQPVLDKARETGAIAGRTVVVADKGINSAPNIDYLVNHGDGFLFSQTLRGKAGTRYLDRLFDEEKYIWNEKKTYKYQIFDEEYKGKDINDRSVIRKRRVLLYWSKEMAERDKKRREQKVARARKKLENNAYKIDHSVDEYLKSTQVDSETGEILKTIEQLSIDDEKIEKQAKFDGYNALISSETDYTERQMRYTYHKLWMIEQSFRIEKTDLETRPIYVRVDDHIRGHLMVCHVGLVFIRLIQLAMREKQISAERIRRVLSCCELITPRKGVVQLLDPSRKIEYKTYIDKKGKLQYKLEASEKDEVLEDFNAICKALGVNLAAHSSSIMRQEEFRKLITSAKVDFQNCSFDAMAEYTDEELSYELSEGEEVSQAETGE